MANNSDIPGTQVFPKGAEVTAVEAGSPSGAQPADPSTVTSDDSDFGYLNSEKPGQDQPTVPPKETVEKKDEEPVLPKLKDEDIPPVAITPPTDDTAHAVPGEDGSYEKRYKDLQSYSDKTIASLKSEVDSARKEIESLQSTKIALEALEKDPHAFAARFFPQLAEQVNPNKAVHEQLKKEFGEKLEAYNASEAYQEGTDSYAIREREMQLREQVQRSRLDGEAARQEEARKREARLSESKAKVMKTYGLNEDQFNKSIIEWAKNNSLDFESIGKLRFFDWHIQNAVTQAINRKNGKTQQTPPSIASISGREAEPNTASSGYKELHDVFGDI